MQDLERDSVTQSEELRKASEAEASARVSRLLDDQLRGHKAEVDSLTAQLATERALGHKAACKARDLAYASVDLKNSIDDLQEENSQLLGEVAYRDARFQEVIESKDLQIQQTRQSLEESLKDTADSKAKLNAAIDREHSFNREIHDRILQVEQIKSAAEDQLSQFDKKTTSCIQKINELETQVAHASDHRQQLSQGHLQEIKQMQGVIEALQDRIQQIHEAKETELESQRLHLTQEHDDSMLKARETHEKALQAEKEYSREQLEELRVSREVAILELEDLHNDYESVIDNFKEKLEETERMLQESKPALKEAQELLDLTKERCSKAESYLQAAVAGDNEKAAIIAAKNAELSRIYRECNAGKNDLVDVKDILAAMNIEFETVATAHDEAISAEVSPSQTFADSAPPSSSSDSTNPPSIHQIRNRIQTHNPQASPEQINPTAASLLSKYSIDANGELKFRNKEIRFMLQSELEKLYARCRDLTNRLKNTESLEIKNVDTSKADLDLLQTEVRKLHAEKVDLQDQLSEADKIVQYHEKRLEAASDGRVFRHVMFTKEARDDMRKNRLQRDDGEDGQPALESIEVCRVPSKLSQPRLPFHGGKVKSQMAEANECDSYSMRVRLSWVTYVVFIPWKVVLVNAERR